MKNGLLIQAWANEHLVVRHREKNLEYFETNYLLKKVFYQRSQLIYCIALAPTYLKHVQTCFVTSARKASIHIVKDSWSLVAVFFRKGKLFQIVLM